MMSIRDGLIMSCGSVKSNNDQLTSGMTNEMKLGITLSQAMEPLAVYI